MEKCLLPKLILSEGLRQHSRQQRDICLCIARRNRFKPSWCIRVRTECTQHKKWCFTTKILVWIYPRSVVCYTQYCQPVSLTSGLNVLLHNMTPKFMVVVSVFWLTSKYNKYHNYIYTRSVARSTPLQLRMYSILSVCVCVWMCVQSWHMHGVKAQKNTQH